MTARDDYPNLAHTWRSACNDDPESLEAEAALDEIDRLRAENESLMVQNELLREEAGWLRPSSTDRPGGT